MFFVLTVYPISFRGYCSVPKVLKENAFENGLSIELKFMM